MLTVDDYRTEGRYLILLCAGLCAGTGPLWPALLVRALAGLGWLRLRRASRSGLRLIRLSAAVFSTMSCSGAGGGSGGSTSATF